jgi:two-component system sensor histidine kinase/response regulator
MPGMDGVSLGRMIKKDENLKNTRLIMLGAKEWRTENGDIQEFDFDATHLNKPVKQSQLYDCLFAVDSGSAQSEMPAEPAAAGRFLTDKQKHEVRILLAEDNVVNRKVALHILEKFGFQADVAVNGREALSALQASSYDLVLMDVQMPEMDGFEATSRIRGGQVASGCTDIPIIAMTAHAMKGDRKRCLDAGMNDYLTKPIDAKTLLEKIETWAAVKHVDSEPAKEAQTPAGPREEDLGGETNQTTTGPRNEDPDGAPLDLDRVAERTIADRDFIKDLLQEFIDLLPGYIEGLQEALQKGDVESLRRRAHTLKGAAANLSADEVAAAALRLEKLGATNNLSEAEDALADVITVLSRLETHIGQIDWEAVAF